ncbi:hypothetical protein [Streptomyces mirabilis]|uniref:hypothetical protein n=1 Tax=Streptomyces mirabilis TaxID=68239 RepID=UPI0033AF26D8
MSDHKQQLDAAVRAFNTAERTEFMLHTATRRLGLDGPAYIVGDIRVMALFEDIHGRHWADGALAAESLGHLAGGQETEDRYHELLCHPDIECRDLWMFADNRGRWNALMAPIDVIAHEFGYPPPIALPGQNWARSWWTLPERSDEQELAWIAHGGDPTQLYAREI